MNAGGKSANMRWTYLGATKGEKTYEVRISGDKLPAAVTRLVIADGKEGGYADVVVQLAGAPPSRMPAGWSAAQPGLNAPDAQSFVGQETVVAGQQSLEARKHRLKTKTGVIDIWLSEKVPPIGVVKALVTDGSAANSGAGGYALSLVAIGTDGKAEIVQTPEPLGRRKSTSDVQNSGQKKQ